MKNNIEKLKMLFQAYDISGYIIPSNDEYFNYYTNKNNNRLNYITNFTGSNGIAIIHKNKNLFFTDGRYIEQSKHELDNTSFDIFDIQKISEIQWNKYFDSNEKIGFDPKLFTFNSILMLDKILDYDYLVKIPHNLVDIVWKDKPKQNYPFIYIYDEKFSGLNYKNKLEICRNELLNHKADALLVTALDSICWLLNIRGAETHFSPIILAKIIVTNTKTYLFTNLLKIDAFFKEKRSDIICLDEKEFISILKLNKKIILDKRLVSIDILDSLKNSEIINSQDPCLLPKACKNSNEIKYSIKNHITDSVALCEFFSYIFETSNILNNQTEITLIKELKNFRLKQKNKGYIQDSFATICGFKENSAIIHYNPNTKNTKTLTGRGILLIDSGAQYPGCTTDVTRTFILGKATKEEKKRYTQVLKGHIALSTIKFPQNTTGGNLDILARQFLLKDLKNYPHGTGHGVGSFLNVHEGPQNISPNNHIVLKPGMILSNEPGYYQVNNFGIRIENLMYVNQIHNSNFLEFITLTLIPYDKNLINYQMLTKEEILYIKNYYKKIEKNILPLLSVRGKKWLNKQLSIS